MVNYQWIIVLLCFMLLFIGAGIQNVFAVFLLPMAREYGWSTSSLALTMTISMLVAGFSHPVIGRLVDKHSPKIVILTGAVIAGASVLLLAFVSVIWHVYLLYGVFFGFTGISSCMVATTALVTRWLSERKSLAFSVFQSAFSLGWFLVVPAATWLILNYGWRFSWLMLGITFLLIVLIASFLIRDPEKAQTKTVNEKDNIASFQAALADRFFPLLLVVFFVCGFTDVPFVTLWVPISLELGVEESIASYTVGFMGAIAFIGTIVIGSLPEKLGYKISFAASYIIRGIALVIPLLLIKSITLYYAFTVLMALSNFGMVPVVSAWLGEVYGSKSVGGLFGLMNFIHYISSSIAIYLFSFIAETYKTYNPVFLISLTLCAISVIACLIIRQTPRLTEKTRKAVYQQTAP